MDFAKVVDAIAGFLMKVHAMKNDPGRALREMADIGFLLKLPGIDEEEVRGYFEKAGLREKYDEIRRSL